MTNVIELAKQAGIEFQKHVDMGGLINVTTRGSQPIEKIETLIKLVRNAALEEAKQAVAPKTPRPCNCEVCDCGNRDDAQRVSEWDSENSAALTIESLKEPTP